GRYDNIALQGASSNGHIEIVNLLLAAGADVNVQGRYSDTALQGASSNGHIEIVKLLLAAGAD
ncbi:ankyrin repeat-containing domain protein, partial [Kalaharituber pfeilii]